MARTLKQRTLADRAVRGGRRIDLLFGGDEPSIPALLLLPKGDTPSPAALLLHGYGSQKDHMTESVGMALLARGIASLAIDLPMHGDRIDAEGTGMRWNPLALARQWKLGHDECALALRYLGARKEVDRERLGIVGYSLGSFLGLSVAARDPAVRVIVLAAGGDLPSDIPFAGAIRAIADPLRAVRKLDGRPLLMVHGRRDRTVRPEQAERLFAAAPEPKEIMWWDAGHYLPPQAIAKAADWMVERI